MTTIVGLTQKQIEVKKVDFLTIYERIRTSVVESAKEAGISWQQVYSWKRNDPKFKEQLETVEEMILDEIMGSMRRTALSCNDKVGLTAGIFLVKGKRPEYKENTRQINVTGEMTLKDKCKANKGK